MCNPVIARMESRLQHWDGIADDKALFLRCYMMMTRNVLSVVERQEFNDSAWVNGLMEDFADYYFVALGVYEANPASAPSIWQIAHNAAQDSQIAAIQKLLLGMNAHINYDLVLTLADLLRSEWKTHTNEQRASRYADHCKINEIIGHTIDAVQDQVLEPAMPIADLFDRLLGPIDEFLILKLIERWRETVWQNAARLLEIEDMQEQSNFIRQVEQEALKTGRVICNRDLTDSLL